MTLHELLDVDSAVEALRLEWLRFIDRQVDERVPVECHWPPQDDCPDCTGGITEDDLRRQVVAEQPFSRWLIEHRASTVAILLALEKR